jgi:hypothetical protein
LIEADGLIFEPLTQICILIPTFRIPMNSIPSQNSHIISNQPVSKAVKALEILKVEAGVIAVALRRGLCS